MAVQKFERYMVRSKIWHARSDHQKALGRTTQNFVSYAKKNCQKEAISSATSSFVGSSYFANIIN